MTCAPPHLSLCMIVRDSARTLAACLDSIRPWVDEMIVVDTGSNDDTRRIARERGAQVLEFPWIDDFSAARNESFRHARGQWIFWMDSDDTIDEENGRALRVLAQGQHASGILGYVVQVHCPSDSDSKDITVVDHVKLIRNDEQIRFEGRIHEQVLPSIRRLGGEVAWTDLFVVHSGADQSPEGKKHKYERDLRLLALDLEERPGHPFVLFNLGMTYADMGQYKTAEDWLRKCLAVSNVGESHVRKAYSLLVSTFQQLQKTEAAWEFCRQGLGHFPDDLELLFRHGMVAHELNRPDEAVTAYRAALAHRGPRHFTSVDRGIVGYKARHNLALVYARQGKQDLAELLWRQVLEARPLFLPAALGLVEALLQQRRHTVIEVELDGWRDLGMPDRDLAIVSAEFHAGRGDVPRANEILREAIANSSRDKELNERLCRLLFEHGRFEDAYGSLQRLISLAPQDASAWHNLGMVALQLGSGAAAIEHFEKSLQLRPNNGPTLSALQAAQRCAAKASSDCIASVDRSVAGPVANGLETLPMAS